MGADFKPDAARAQHLILTKHSKSLSLSCLTHLWWHTGSVHKAHLRVEAWYSKPVHVESTLQRPAHLSSGSVRMTADRRASLLSSVGLSRHFVELPHDTSTSSP